MKEMKLFFHQISNTNDIHFEKAINIYNDSFPANERQPLAIIKKRITEEKSKLFVGLLNNEVIGMALLWDFSDLEFVLLDYMAIAENYRNKKFGTDLFKFLTDNNYNYNKYMIIEVENYLFGINTEQRKKRINFYIRNGAYILKDLHYMLPSLDNTLPTEMILMMSPKYKKNNIEKMEIERLIKRLYVEVYGKTEEDNLLISILKEIPDKITFENKVII